MEIVTFDFDPAFMPEIEERGVDVFINGIHYHLAATSASEAIQRIESDFISAKADS